MYQEVAAGLCGCLWYNSSCQVKLLLVETLQQENVSVIDPKLLQHISADMERQDLFVSVRASF